MKILSIDAWRYGGQWHWNNWFHRGDISREDFERIADSPRKLFRWLRENGVLSDASIGRIEREDDGYNIVIMDRGTREPLIALEYGAEAWQ